MLKFVQRSANVAFGDREHFAIDRFHPTCAFPADPSKAMN
jgi:hypothetical protein